MDEHHQLWFLVLPVCFCTVKSNAVCRFCSIAQTGQIVKDVIILHLIGQTREERARELVFRVVVYVD